MFNTENQTNGQATSIGAFFVRLCLTLPRDRFDELAQAAVLTNMRCGLALTKWRPDHDNAKLEEARLLTAFALQLVSDHVKHYPFLERQTVQPQYLGLGIHEPSLSMATPLGQDAVFTQATAFVELAKAIVDDLTGDDVQEVRNYQLDLLSAADGGSCTHLDQASVSEHLARLAEAFTSKCARHFIVFTAVDALPQGAC